MITDILNRDAQEFWNQLQATKAANPPKPKEIIVEVTQETRTEIIPPPEDEMVQ